MSETKTIADGKLEITFDRFEPLLGYEMLGKFIELGPKARTDTKFMREMFRNASAIRRDVPAAEQRNISLGSGDAAINAAFRGLGLSAMVEALAFTIDLSFADFFVDAASKKAKLAATVPAAE